MCVLTRKTVLTPFRQCFNAGDYLGTINSGPHPKLPQINQVNSLMAILTAPGQDGLQSGGAGFTEISAGYMIHQITPGLKICRLKIVITMILQVVAISPMHHKLHLCVFVIK